MTATDNSIPPQQFYHGTCAVLKPGDPFAPGYDSNDGNFRDLVEFSNPG